MKEEKKYKYDAFISYRHCDLDKFVAEKLHKILETYELPKSIKKKLNIKDKSIKRVFRDQEELPLSSNLEDPIVDALENTKYLIVICSPRLKDSLWCKKEIETFKKLRGRKNIFCVLVEGEPVDSFPDELKYDDDGKTPVEPLAADVRGKNKKEVLKKINSEKLRLVAPMFNLDYDDLKQRHKLRKQKRIINISIITALVCLLFALYTSIMLIKINSQQNKLKKHQAVSLATSSKNNLAKDSRYAAIKDAYQSLTKFEGVKMPYTPDAEYALVESLGIYDVGFAYKAIDEVKTDGVIDYLKSSFDGKYAAIYDESEKITLIETKTLKIIATYSVNASYSSENSFTFVGNNYLAFINEKGNISIVKVKDGKKVKEIKKNDYSFSSIKGEQDGKYLTYIDQNVVYIYDINKQKNIASIKTSDKYLNNIYYSLDSKYIFVFRTTKDFNINNDEYITMDVISLLDGSIVNSEVIQAGYVNGLVNKGNNAYIIFNNYNVDKMNSIIVSYNYVDGIINWSNTYDNSWIKKINKSYPDDTNDIVVANYDNLLVLNCEDGSSVETFNTSSEIIEIYSFFDREMYLVILSNGSVNYVNMETRKSIEYMGKYDFNVDNYTDIDQSENGFLLVPKNENRAILYEQNKNKDVKKVDIEIKNDTANSISVVDYDKLKDEYKVKNKNLVKNMFYDNKKELLFVCYTNLDLAIYNVKDKKLLKYLNEIGHLDRFYGTDINDRLYIGDITDAYILDKNYNKVGHINRLTKVDKDKIIIYDDKNYYELKIYNLDELVKIAKKYLDEKSRI